ncbi:hypothetical protein EG68_01903 [Paragonimus skrjabini miyazakii]|uniref:Uncharacterized protein n=1 Tax=Paragonimus skrjabini miyazakii TaxID=59628 RepID=A0A8S9Z676_9TREM|nr:hypothetical protein EG68_01903 [Paragonimus skrjabini miyazakii]
MGHVVCGLETGHVSQGPITWVVHLSRQDTCHIPTSAHRTAATKLGMSHTRVAIIPTRSLAQSSALGPVDAPNVSMSNGIIVCDLLEPLLRKNAVPWCLHIAPQLVRKCNGRPE